MRHIVCRTAAWALVLSALAVSGCGNAGAPSSSSATNPGARRASARSTSAAPGKAARVASPGARTATDPARRQRDPGTLPQTPQRPSRDSAVFASEVRDFWRAVVTNSVQAGMPAFFPESAYAQIKTLGNPRGDWVIRLLLDYRLDIGAAHGLLGPHPGTAQLVGVRVPMAFAHWVPPGSCYNDVGYWEVPNSRVVFRAGGTERSFGIASLISWRGVWYIVHLGATFRVGNIPVLDDPASGPGVSAPSSTC